MTMVADPPAVAPRSSDMIGTVPVPDPPVDAVDFSQDTGLHPPFGVNVLMPSRMAVHGFQAGDQKREQRFLLGNGAREWSWTQDIDPPDWIALRNFWEARQGSARSFYFQAPTADGGIETVTVHFASEPLVYNYGTSLAAQAQIHFIETALASSAPSYPLNGVLDRVPDSTFANALTAQAQTIIPLVMIQPRKAGYPPMYLSDRRVTIGSQTYLPRLLSFQGIGQSAVGLPNVTGESDNVVLSFGNADRVMQRVADSVLLDQAKVQFSLYHVDSGVRLDFWGGQVVPGGWQSNVGPEFRLQCSDLLASPFLICPPRIIDRRCNALFNDGSQCPFAAKGTMDLVHFPSGDSSVCDHGYSTDNGCLAHGMKYYFRGIIAQPQGVRVMDNSTGTFGFARQTITSFSLISDTVYGVPLPIIVTDLELITADPTGSQYLLPLTKGFIIEGRDEGDYYEALAIVAEGPIVMGQYTRLDGQVHVGYPDYSKNIRFINGMQPAGPGDFISLDQKGNQLSNDINLSIAPAWRWVYVPSDAFPGDTAEGMTVADNFSAGVAAIAMRIVDSPGLQLTNLDTHDLEVDIVQGWFGWTWSGPGSRNAQMVSLSNPVWLAVNIYLYCIGLKDAAPATQEQYIDVPSCVAAAAVCDLMVDRTVENPAGTPQEHQYRFSGTIRDQRPLRDWLNDILVNCLGYFYFSNGKLAIGVRHHDAGPPSHIGITSNYSDYNMVAGSLSLEGIGAQFTQLIGSFADHEHNWQTNTASYQDDDFAAELGSGLIPSHRQSKITFSGVYDISQATRLVVTRGREEIGGVTTQERRAARHGQFKTSILGLDTRPGDVISITQADMPGGYGLARVEKLTLNADWSIDIIWRTVTLSMYDLSLGFAPADVRPGPVPVVKYPLPTAVIWGPDTEPYLANDPVYGAPYGNSVDLLSFKLSQSYGTAKDGSPLITLTVTGNLPPNSTDGDIQTPVIRSYRVRNSGGHLPDGVNIYLCIACIKFAAPGLGAGRVTMQSNIIQFNTPQSGGINSVDLLNILLPAGPQGGTLAWDSVEFYAGYTPASMTFQLALPPSSLPNVGGQGANYTFTGILPPAPPLNRNYYNPPSTLYESLEIKAKWVVHSGPVGATVTAVDVFTITCSELANGVDNWIGRILTVQAMPPSTLNPIPDLPILNFQIDGFDNTSGTFTCDTDPKAAGVVPGCVIAVRYKADTIDDYSIGDSRIDNGQYPGGEVTDAQKGKLIRVMSGPGAGQIRQIISNTSTVYHIDNAWSVRPTAASIWIIEEPTWRYTASSRSLSSPVSNSRRRIGIVMLTEIALSMGVPNLEMFPVLVGGFLVDRLGYSAPDELAPVREIFLYGAQGERTINTSQTQRDTDRIIKVDASGGPVVYTLLPFDQIISQNLYIQKIDNSGNKVTWICQGSDAVNGNASGDLTTQFDSIFITFLGE